VNENEGKEQERGGGGGTGVSPHERDSVVFLKGEVKHLHGFLAGWTTES